MAAGSSEDEAGLQLRKEQRCGRDGGEARYWAGAPAERIQSVAPRQDQEHDEQRNDEHDPNRREHEVSVAYANSKQAVAVAFSAQTGQSPVTGASDKVQIMRSISAMQASGHVQQNGTGSIVPALAKNARTGQPLSRNGKRNHAGRATRPLS
jgi:hypothetical protein